jgi:hypothetical protein
MIKNSFIIRKKIVKSLALMLLSLLSFICVEGQAEDTITVSDPTISLTVTEIGTPATGYSTYSITTDGTGTKKITGILDFAMPAGVTLKVTLEKPDVSSTSYPDVVMDATANNLVTGIPATLSATDKLITCKLYATVAAGVVSGTRTLTLTITN